MCFLWSWTGFATGLPSFFVTTVAAAVIWLGMIRETCSGFFACCQMV
jgi:hypothetical protein